MARLGGSHVWLGVGKGGATSTFDKRLGHRWYVRYVEEINVAE